MLVSKQITKVNVQSQAQERLLVKVVKQNEAASKILNNIEKIVVGISNDIKSGFHNINVELLKMNNMEGLEEVKELWIKRMNDLEKLIQNGGDNSSQQIENHMKKLEAVLTAKLIDLDVNSDGIKKELQLVRQQIIETNNLRLKGDIQSEEKLLTILNELKGLQKQLDRIEEITTKIFNGMEDNFSEIRQQLLQNSNSEGLTEIRDLWLKKLNDLDKVIQKSSNDNNQQVLIDNQMKKMEAMLNAKLIDLDLNISSMSPMLNEVKEKLHEVILDKKENKENSDIKYNSIMIELKGLQTQLIEVIHLEKENFQMLSQVINNYIFIFNILM